MAVTLEQVERLRDRADISYEEAKTLLEQCGGDLLEALILLERRGSATPTGQGGFYSTRPGSVEQRTAALILTDASQSKQRDHRETSGFGGQLRELLLAFLNLLRHSLANQFDVWQGRRAAYLYPHPDSDHSAYCCFLDRGSSAHRSSFLWMPVTAFPA